MARWCKKHDVSVKERNRRLDIITDRGGFHYGRPDLNGHAAWPPPNVWLGVSVEDQPAADERLPDLRKLAGQGWHTLVSVEPLLGPLNTSFSGVDWVICGGESGPGARPMHPDWARSIRDECQAAGVPYFFKQWGEWAATCQMPAETSDLTRAQAASLNIFGERVSPPGIGDDGLVRLYRVGKKAAGRTLDGRVWDELPGAMKGQENEDRATIQDARIETVG